MYYEMMVAATGPIVSGLFGWFILRQGRLTHDTFNSKMDALLALTEKAAFARGQKAESDARDTKKDNV